MPRCAMFAPRLVYSRWIDRVGVKPRHVRTRPKTETWMPLYFSGLVVEPHDLHLLRLRSDAAGAAPVRSLASIETYAQGNEVQRAFRPRQAPS